jgi:hypothetical protein
MKVSRQDMGSIKWIQINDHCQDKEEILIDIEFKAPKVIFTL